MELWKNIKGYEDYQISNYGKVKSLKFRKDKILSNVKGKDGYFRVGLSKCGTRKIKLIHVLEYEAFNNRLNDNECIHHIDENKENNCISNLIKMNISEHQSFHNKDKIISDNHKKLISIKNKGKKYSEHTKELMSQKQKGKNNPQSILTEQKVIEIRKYLDEGILTQIEIAKLFGISKQTVSAIKNKKVWKHIKSQ